jgi:hypothetical protein
MCKWLKEIFNPSIPPVVERRPQSSPDTTMNEGDYHSGPHGYSPNTEYPETQYGSSFDEEADWNEDEWR